MSRQLAVREGENIVYVTRFWNTGKFRYQINTGDTAFFGTPIAGAVLSEDKLVDLMDAMKRLKEVDLK